MRIQSSGRISWSPSGIFVVSCDSDITYYPLDYQSCYVKVSTWGYTQTEITLVYDQDTPVELGFYSTNGEWDLVSAAGTETEDRSRGGQTFSTLKFQIDLQRLPLYHVMNTLVPVLLMAFLIPAAFKVPPGCGEKVGYTLTVLLAYAVYLTIVSDNIPSTSENVSYLSVYLGLIFLYGVISVFLVILVLCLHEKADDDPIPAWLRKLTLSFLIPVTCWKQGIGCPNKRKKFAVKHDKGEKTNIQEKKQNGSYVTDNEAPDEHAQLKWQTVAGALDNFLFMIMMIVVVITTLVLFTIIIVNYAQNI
ncbi:hypothetical protein FSP39_024430 [Pinctada imbricata]|uniref:Uncharacterized protein n=1 Tax=Pinctada imbricata TaxID=66713 RepID=A0AA88Y8B7_PINIB|nr:hypothetical protein FSP39_024430 [Pinctada imbricata]